MTRKTRNWLITLLILTSPFLFFLGLVFFWTAEPLQPLAPLPNPNGYDDLVKAGIEIRNVIKDGNVSEYDMANLKTLREIVSTNTGALALARSALSNQCGVPLQFTKAYLTNHDQDVIAFRSLAQTLACEGKFAEKENRFGDAANSYLDVVRLGNDAGRGGIVIDEMIATAIERIGLEQLQKIADDLDAHSCRDTIQSLETLDADRQTWAATMQQQEDWSRRTYSGLQGRMLLIYYHVLYFRTREHDYQHCVDAINSTQKQEGQLLIDLAARAYKLDKGRSAASIADLVPDYLKAVPQDPVAGTNLVYPSR